MLRIQGECGIRVEREGEIHFGVAHVIIHSIEFLIRCIQAKSPFSRGTESTRQFLF